MALEQERKSLGVRHILRKLRGTSPRPLSPEDQVQSLLSEPGTGIEAGTKVEEEPGSLAETRPGGGGGRSPLLSGLRGARAPGRALP